MIKALRFMLVLALLLPFSVWASFEHGLAFYQKGNFEKAYAVFKSMAAIGDKSSQFNLGVMYYRGEFVAVDPVQAYAWVSVAADQGDQQFIKVKDKIWNGLSELDKINAQTVEAQLAQIYGAESISKTIFPKPLDDKDCQPELLPIAKKTLKYPENQLWAGQVGQVIVEFTVSPQGYVRDIVADLNDSHKNFIQASVKAVQQFRYEKPVRGGVSVFIPGMKHAIIFKIKGGPKVNVRRLKKQVELLKVEAEKGSRVAQYQYASFLDMLRRFEDISIGANFQFQESNKWYLSSAKLGLANSQFELGRNMVLGRGCEIDQDSGIKWVNAAAYGGYAPAQKYIAQSLIDDHEIQQLEAAITWLRSAVLADYYPAKVMLAWELATASYNSIRDGNEALALMMSKPVNYYDKVRVFETKAAIYAELGKFKKAVKMQKKAVGYAKKLDWVIPVMQERLIAYEAEHAWRGSYYEVLREETVEKEQVTISTSF